MGAQSTGKPYFNVYKGGILKVKKSVIIAGAVATIGLAGAGGLGVASAAGNVQSSATNNSLIDKLASKFNLKKADVQAVFDEDRTARQAARQQQVEERLTQAVTDGKITAAQKAAILAKQAELQAKMNADRASMPDKTPAERRALMEQNRAELKQWAADNSIPAAYLRLVRGGVHGHGGMDPSPAT